MADIRSGAKALRQGRVSLAGQIYHVTTRTHGRQPLFHDLWRGRAVIRAMKKGDDNGLTATLAYVVMPDHLHWLIDLKRGELAIAVRLLKGRSSRELGRHGHGGRVWQAGFYDHALRSDEGVIEVARYIIANPLRAGLVERVADYPLWDCTWV